MVDLEICVVFFMFVKHDIHQLQATIAYLRLCSHFDSINVSVTVLKSRRSK